MIRASSCKGFRPKHQCAASTHSQACMCASSVLLHVSLWAEWIHNNEHKLFLTPNNLENWCNSSVSSGTENKHFRVPSFWYLHVWHWPSAAWPDLFVFVNREVLGLLVSKVTVGTLDHRWKHCCVHETNNTHQPHRPAEGFIHLYWCVFLKGTQRSSGCNWSTREGGKEGNTPFHPQDESFGFDLSLPKSRLINN